MDDYEMGIAVERDRIIQLLKDEADSRDIMQALSYPYLAQELEALIREGQDG